MRCYYVVFQFGPITGAIEYKTDSLMENFQEVNQAAQNIRAHLRAGDLSPAPPLIILSWREIKPTPLIINNATMKEIAQ